LLLKDRGFLYAMLATCIIGGLASWSIVEKEKRHKETQEYVEKNRQNFKSFEETLKKLDIAIKESEESSKMLDNIKRDLDEIQNLLKDRGTSHEKEARKTQDTRDH